MSDLLYVTLFLIRLIFCGPSVQCESLTFPLDLEYTDGILWREVAELAGGQCVPPLPERAGHPQRRF